jgi:hypothetical protein
LAETLRAEGKPAPLIRLAGHTWWDDGPVKHVGRIKDFVLRSDGLAVSVADKEHTYAGTLTRNDAQPNEFDGCFRFDGGSGTARCQLSRNEGGTYKLRGKWKQTSSGEKVLDWSADLEPEGG